MKKQSRSTISSPSSGIPIENQIQSFATISPLPIMESHNESSNNPRNQTHSRARPITIQNPNLRRRLFQEDIEESSQQEEEAQLNLVEDHFQNHFEQARIDNAVNLGKELLDRDRVEMKEKWNFDFEMETPLDGEWEWEAVVEVVGARDTGEDTGRVDSIIRDEKNTISGTQCDM